MQYWEATRKIRNELEEENGRVELVMSMNRLSRFQAMRYLVALDAPSYAQEFTSKRLTKPGQIAQALSGWHLELSADCSEVYRDLTDSGSMRSRTLANAHPELLTLQAIRRGVRDTMRRGYRFAPVELSVPSLPWPVSAEAIRQWAAPQTAA
ncbi:MAG TPA: hypothetical protein VHB72_03030 [Candidatus Saccharimonadales bacterium]|nr:hypothetical protein [Candidatus Saccharimonadales bacterium]